MGELRPKSDRAVPVQTADRVINAAAPVRVCDNGGWTDTWFAKTGYVLNIAVSPCVRVQLGRARYPYCSGPVPVQTQADDAIRAAAELFEVDPETLNIAIEAQMPAGAGTGTSAAMFVALVAAMRALHFQPIDREDIARQAHRSETEILGRESGIQDQLAASLGGINLIEIHQFPAFSVRPVKLTPELLWELEGRLLLIYLGRSHDSSLIHQEVIRTLSGARSEPAAFSKLRAAACDSYRALTLQRDLRTTPAGFRR